MSEPRRYADGDGGEILEYRAVPQDKQKGRPLQVGDRVKVVANSNEEWGDCIGQTGTLKAYDGSPSPFDWVVYLDSTVVVSFTKDELELIPEESLDEKLDRIDPQPSATASGICEDDWKGPKYQGSFASGETCTMKLAGYDDTIRDHGTHKTVTHYLGYGVERSHNVESTACDICVERAYSATTPRRRALMEAADIVDNERNHEYGEPKDNLGRTAALVQVLFPERQWTPADIALFMVMVKAARLVHTRGHDTGIDLLGWGALYLELEES